MTSSKAIAEETGQRVVARCMAKVWKRDTYRRTGRGKSGFEMHFSECQCTRNARATGYCWQHEPPVRS